MPWQKLRALLKKNPKNQNLPNKKTMNRKKDKEQQITYSLPLKRNDAKTGADLQATRQFADAVKSQGGGIRGALNNIKTGPKYPNPQITVSTKDYKPPASTPNPSPMSGGSEAQVNTDSAGRVSLGSPTKKPFVPSTAVDLNDNSKVKYKGT